LDAVASEIRVVEAARFKVLVEEDGWVGSTWNGGRELVLLWVCKAMVRVFEANLPEVSIPTERMFSPWDNDKPTGGLDRGWY
jgi:hypothetical protein